MGDNFSVSANLFWFGFGGLVFFGGVLLVWFGGFF